MLSIVQFDILLYNRNKWQELICALSILFLLQRTIYQEIVIESFLIIFGAIFLLLGLFEMYENYTYKLLSPITHFALSTTH